MLTVVLPLKDRSEFTGRFLESAGNLRVIVADGSAFPQNVEGHEYHYFGEDTSVSRWYFKNASALELVDTPYAMIADNDDFLMPANLLRCVEFLERNPDFVCCSGRIGGIWIWPNKVVGPHCRFSRLYSPYDKPATYGQDSINQRVLAGFTNSWSYYAVYRTEALRIIWNEVKDIGFTNLQVLEKFCAIRALTLGKVHCDPRFTSYVRQHRTSRTAAVHNTDFIGNIFSTDLGREFRLVLDRLNGSVPYVDTAALECLWIEWFQDYITRNYGPVAMFRKRAKSLFPYLAEFIQERGYV